MNAYDILEQRGYLKQTTHEGLRDLLGSKNIPFYIGFDPTADSLHVGHYVALMAMSHMQQCGHRPIVLLGGGTTMVGDPSGKTDMRKMLTKELIAENADKFKVQISKFLDFSEDKAIMVNNADWLLNLNYVEFLRDVGVHFSVNRMLTAECFKSRMERGLNFLEFNYMLMQSYDFLVLYKQYGAVLQMGGDDQWSNILGGADLIRRKEQGEAFGLTFSLLLTSEGKKMGKTEKGALWLDPAKTTPYEFYQYFRNVNDSDVANCLKLLTFVPLEEIERLCAYCDERMNVAKRLLAFEVTKQVHGEEEATKAQEASAALFEGGALGGAVPTTALSRTQLNENVKLFDLMVTTGLAKSKGEARRLIAGGGVYVNDEKVTDEFYTLSPELMAASDFMLRKGKKIYHRVEVN